MFLMSIAACGKKSVVDHVKNVMRPHKRGRQQRNHVVDTSNDYSIVTSLELQQRKLKQQFHDSSNITQLTVPGPNMRAVHRSMWPSQVNA